MNYHNQETHQAAWLFRHVVTFVAVLALFTARSLMAADEPGLGDKAKETVRETSAAVADAGNKAADSAKDLWQRIDAARLKNRTPDELAAWVIMGVLVGAVAGMMTTLKSTGLGKVGRLLLGLAGACLGGIVVHLGRFDFGWGLVVIRYEELFFSLLGAIVLIVLGRFIRSRMKKKVPAK